jgi:hypothetical protein
MTRGTRLSGMTVTGLLCLLLVNSAAEAHFIWADVQPRPDGTSEARIYFGELPKPGEPELIGKIAETRAWLRGPDNHATALKLARSSDATLAALVAGLAPARSASLEATCDYGVFQRGPAALLLQYYAKHLPDDWAQLDEKLTRSEKLRLDIVPRLSGDQLSLRVLYEGTPAVGREVIVLDPSGKQHELKTDEEGRVSMAVLPGGSYAVRAAHVEAERGGERDGKSFSQTWHYCTLTLAVPKAAAPPAAKASEISAADLLARARAARSVWQGFPGFSADINVNLNGRQAAGRLVVEPQGTVTLEFPDPVLREWAEEQLNSLVQHRMPEDNVQPGKVKYADNDLTHPMGRKIDLGDLEVNSVYRIRDDVITEVSRKMGKTRFTISVLEVMRDPDDKYLPRSFTMNLFDAATSELKISRGFWNDWQRVGNFDLPKIITEVVTHDGAVETRQMTLSNWRLGKGEEK